MIDPKKAMFLYTKSEAGKQGGILAVDIDSYRMGAYRVRASSLGACYAGWIEMDNEQIYQAMHWIALEIAEFSGVPIRRIRDEMERVDGYREFARGIGCMALCRGDRVQ